MTRVIVTMRDGDDLKVLRNLTKAGMECDVCDGVGGGCFVAVDIGGWGDVERLSTSSRSHP